MRAIQKSLFFFLLIGTQVGFSQNAVDWNLQAEELHSNRETWDGLGIDSYSVTVDKGCFGCNWFYPAKVVVRDGQIVAVLNPETDEPLLRRVRGEEGELAFPKWKDRYQTIDAIFSLIESAIENNETTAHHGTKASDLSVTYDEQYGFPLSMSVGYYGGISEDGSEFTMTDGGLSFSLEGFASAL